jgi:flagellar basal body-associated protein FliL
MNKSHKSKPLNKAILIIGVVILAVGLALLIRLVFFKPLPVEAPSEQPEIEMQENDTQPPVDDQSVQEEEQLERSTIE